MSFELNTYNYLNGVKLSNLGEGNLAEFIKLIAVKWQGS